LISSKRAKKKFKDSRSFCSKRKISFSKLRSKQLILQKLSRLRKKEWKMQFKKKKNTEKNIRNS